jgi:hypothetical protein
MDAQQELFTRLKLAIEELGYDVYDGFLPPEDTPYPFVYLGEMRQNDNGLKNAVVGIVYPQIHVWINNPNKRGTLSKMMSDIKTECRSIVRTANHGWYLRGMNQHIFSDTTTKTPLLHGVIEPEFQFS